MSGLNVPDHFGRQYANTVMLLSQQKGSRLRGTVSERTDYKGEQASPTDQVAKIEMEEVTARFEEMGRVDSELKRRWVFPTSHDLNQQVDHFDQLQLLLDPKSKYVENAVNAVGRRIDRTIINAMRNVNKTGKNGGTSTTALAGNTIAVGFGASSDVSLTVAKLIEAKRILRAANVHLEEEEIHCAITALEEAQLLKESQIISLDFRDRAVLEDGQIRQFLGIKFHHTEIVGETLSSGDNQVPLWVKSGMHLALWEDMRTDISMRNDIKGLPWQAYLYITMDATRLEEEKIINIKCQV